MLASEAAAVPLTWLPCPVLCHQCLDVAEELRLVQDTQALAIDNHQRFDLAGDSLIHPRQEKLDRSRKVPQNRRLVVVGAAARTLHIPDSEVVVEGIVRLPPAVRLKQRSHLLQIHRPAQRNGVFSCLEQQGRVLRLGLGTDLLVD